MTILDNGSIMTGICYVLWDGINNPEDVPATKEKAATLKYSVAMAFPPDAPEYGEMYAAIQREEAKVMVNGALPNGWNPAFTQVDVTKIPEIPGYIKINAATFGNLPPVLDINETELSPAQYARALYAGAKVRAIVSPRTYDAKGNKGSGFWLAALQVVDATSPQFSVAAGLSVGAVKSAFGAAKVGGVPVAGAGMAAAAGAAVPVVPGAAPAPGGAPAAPVVPQTPAAPATPTPVPPNYAAVPGPSSAGPAAPAVPGTPPAPQGAPTPPSAPTAPTSPSKTLTPLATQAAPGLDLAGWLKTWTEDQMIASGYLVVS